MPIFTVLQSAIMVKTKDGFLNSSLNDITEMSTFDSNAFCFLMPM